MAGIFQHPRLARREMLQAGGIGLLGLASCHLAELRAATTAPKTPQRAVIYIFLSGGLSQHESFDPKPDAPVDVRGEFGPIATNTPGLQICEHLPLLAQRSQMWSVVRSLTHASNDHSAAHHIMLTGRSDVPPGFNPLAPRPEDHPCIASIAGDATTARNNLPPSVVLPEKLVHSSGRIIPGQFAGVMGSRRDPWFIEASPFDNGSYGAYPEYGFDHQGRPHNALTRKFQAPLLTLPEGLTMNRLERRFGLLDHIDRQRIALDQGESSQQFGSYRQAAVSMLMDQQVRRAFDVSLASPEKLEQYGKNSFGWSLLMAARLVEAGVNLVQVNLGNDESWDTHGNAFPNLKDKLLPPMDRGVSALLDDLQEQGLLESTLVVMGGEFGRTPKVSHLREHYALPGRDHWGAVQSVFFAGGGTVGGRVVGASDAIGAYPIAAAQSPENFAATIYQALGIPETAAWKDDTDRPHHIYHGLPISGLV